MVSLAIGTDSAVLRHDTETGETFILEVDRPGYYGISWFTDDERVFRTHSENGRFGSIEAYMRSEVGFISAGEDRSQPILSNPHQICCLTPPYLAATNTGRNCLSIINTDDWSCRQFRFDDVYWDRFDPAGQGSHFNSIEFDGERLYVLAHNFDAGSYELTLDWPGLELIGRRTLPGRQLHNLWHRGPGECLSCDSPNGALIDVGSGRTLWRFPDERYYARGLASTAEHIFVGGTQFAARGERSTTPSRIFVVDADAYTTLGEIELGLFGGVNEIRVIDKLDLCHRVGPRPVTGSLVGRPAAGHALQRVTPEDAANKAVILPTLERLIRDRDDYRDAAHEACAQHDRVVRERLDMMQERDSLQGLWDEAQVQHARITGELSERIAERDAAVSERDEAQMQQSRLEGEVAARIAERDTAISQRDEAQMHQSRLEAELAARIAERDAAVFQRNEAQMQQSRLEGEVSARIAERDAAISQRDEA